MNDAEQQESFLQQLHQMTGGDPEQPISMYDVGEAIGLERNEAGRLAEQLMLEGLIELVTLAGGVSLTSAGLAQLGYATAPAVQGELVLGTGPVADEQDRVIIEELCQTVRSSMEKGGPYELLKLIIVHLKTIEVQLLSERPRIPVCREVFAGIVHECKERGVELPSHFQQFV